MSSAGLPSPLRRIHVSSAGDFGVVRLEASDTGRESFGGVVTARVLLDPFSGVQILQVEDNGPGIPPTILDNLFTPFNTSKEAGLGRGSHGVGCQLRGCIHTFGDGLQGHLVAHGVVLKGGGTGPKRNAVQSQDSARQRRLDGGRHLRHFSLAPKALFGHAHDLAHVTRA